jgi:hypothetical protein
MANFEQANGGGVLSLEPSLAAASAAEEAVGHHDWDKNDYKAFISSQRAARTLQQQQQQQQQHDEGDAAFAFRNSCPTRRIRESCEEQHMESMERDHHDSQAQMLYVDMDAALPLHWESLINTSCRSRRHSYSSSSSSSSSSSREFEFHMQQVQIRPEVVAAAEDAAAGDHHLHVGRDVVQGISHADELFYKGQLLPLHLHPRQQMVEKLTSEYSHVNQQEKAAATVAAAASDDDHAAALLDSSSYVKFCVNSCTDDLHVAAAAADVLVDSRSSSFRSQSSSSYWESATAENSSSRDSNGSSQDACCFVNSSNNDNELQLLETQLSATNVGALGSKPPPLIKLSSFQKQKLQKQQESPFLHNREVFSTHMNCCKSAPSPDADQSTTKSTTSVFSSWLRPPFKWKVLFGVKKVSKTPTRKDQTTLERCNPLSTPESSYSSSSSSSSSACSPTSSTSSYSAAADLVHSHAPDQPAPNKHSTSSSEADSSISSCEIRKSTAAREPAADEEESLRASAACSSAGAAAGEGSKTTREHQQQQHRWKKYIKMLKLPAYGKIMMQQQQQKQQQHIFDLVKIDFKNVAAATAASEPISSSNPAAAAASSRRAGSLSFIKPAAAAPPPPPPPPPQAQAQAQAQKPLSGSLSFPSSSMMSPTSRMAAAAMGGGGVPGAPRRSSAHASDSTTNSGQLLLRPVFSQSTISDLQSSLQGAIAHCKQSHCAHI